MPSQLERAHEPVFLDEPELVVLLHESSHGGSSLSDGPVQTCFAPVSFPQIHMVGTPPDSLRWSIRPAPTELRAHEPVLLDEPQFVVLLHESSHGWGLDPFGLLGTRNPFGLGFSPVPIDIPSVPDAVDVDMSANHCVARRGGVVACAGDNSAGQMSPHPHPVPYGELQIIENLPP